MQITTLKNYLANLCFLPAAQICLSFFDDAFDKTAIVKGGDDFEEISEDALDETVKEGDGLKETKLQLLKAEMVLRDLR